MSNKLTWVEFVQLYKPKAGDKFLDDRGKEWVYKLDGWYFGDYFQFHSTDGLASYLTCPLTPPKQKRKMWPALWKTRNGWFQSDQLFVSEEEARSFFDAKAKVIWPAIPGPDGSYEINEEQ